MHRGVQYLMALLLSSLSLRDSEGADRWHVPNIRDACMFRKTALGHRQVSDSAGPPIIKVHDYVIARISLGSLFSSCYTPALLPCSSAQMQAKTAASSLQG